MGRKIDQDFLYKKNRLQQIKGFYYTAKLGSISEAAKAMNLTQSTVTLQIQSLERDMNLQLLRRGSKPLSLTKDGEEFYNLACPLMHEFELIVKKFVSDKDQKELQKIDIAVHNIAISYLMPQAVNLFLAKSPKSKITIRNIAFDDAIRRLKDGKIDLLFFPNALFDPDLEIVELVSYDPILIMNKNHHLANKEINNISDLKQFNLIKIDQNLANIALFEEVVRAHDLKGSVEFENGDWEILKHFVEKNDFVAIVSKICVGENDDLMVKNLVRFFPKMTYFLLYRKGERLKPLVLDFIDALRKSLKL